MNIDVIKRLALDGDLFAIQALVDRPEALEKVFGHLGTPDEVGNEWHALSERLEAAESDGLEQARLLGMSGEREAALLSKLEVAEKAVTEAYQRGYATGREEIEKERDELRAKIEAMEKQEPVAWLHESRRDSDVVTNAVKHVWGKAAVGALAAYSIPLYTLPGAQPAPSVPEGVASAALKNTEDLA
jgi:hypothetical protein